MSRKIKDTDYLFATAYVRSKEAGLLTREQLERVIGSGSYREGARILEELGYANVSGMDAIALEEYLSSRGKEIISDLRSVSPDKSLVDAFTIKYDYHNIKVLLKSEAGGGERNALLSSSGSIPEGVMRDAYHKSEYTFLPGIMAEGIAQARETLGRTGDPQLADIILDRAYFRQLAKIAEDSGSQFLAGYAKLTADSANLRSAVRLARMEKDAAFMKRVLTEGGNIGVDRVISAFTSGRQITSVYEGSRLFAASEKGAAALDGKASLTIFEKLCDDAVTSYLADAKYTGFGEKALVAYIYAAETELSSLRIILTQLKAGLPAKVIRERLRDSYV